MLKMSVNRVRLDLRIEPVTPLLIKSGDKGASLLHPERPDLSFVRTRQGDSETVYMPGSSLKGVVRSAAERVLRTVERHCCDPMDSRSDCHQKASRLGDDIARRPPPEGAHSAHPMAPVHAMLCYACRTFGSQALASRIAFADAYPSAADRSAANETERRNGVSIDRTTGGPARGKLFDMEVVTGGAFETSIRGLNLQLWQLALLGLVLRELDEGFVRCGSAKSRGLGHVRVIPTGLVFDQIDTAATPAGVGVLRPDLVAPYDLVDATHDMLSSDAGAGTGRGPFGPRWTYPREAVWTLLDACAGEPWSAFMACARPGAA